MDVLLDDAEVRILGCLIEKEMTTPEYYPLSLNALTNACNQKSNRSPVVSYDEAMLTHKIEGLRQKGLVSRMQAQGSRVAKYLHAALDRFDLSRQEVAVLCELMLRGPQTLGELRSHAERMSSFEGLEQVEGALQGLMSHDPPLVMRLQREAGRKECRHVHLLSGVPDMSAQPAAPEAPVEGRIAVLEAEIARLRGELEELRQAFAAFRPQP